MSTAQAETKPAWNGALVEAQESLAGSTPKRRGELRMARCECVIDVVSAYFNLPSKEIRRPGRARLPVVRVRQVAMYVSHVTLRVPMHDVGRCFAKDRTTVAHACQVIEDMREDQEFDQILERIERVIRTLVPVEEGLSR